LKNNAADSDASCRHRIQTSLVASAGAGLAGSAGSQTGALYTRDGERISICMRVSDGARNINRHGGAIFTHAAKRIRIMAAGERQGTETG
jgi:hypothetical protein